MSEHEEPVFGTGRTFAVIAPDYLVSELASVLESADETRDAMKSGALLLSSDAPNIRADERVVVAPSLLRLMESMRRDGDTWTSALSSASHTLSLFAQAAASANALVVSEQDIKSRPDFLTEAITSKEKTSPTVEANELAESANQRSMETGLPPNIQPLQMYNSLPVRPGAFAWWPYAVFLTAAGQCPAVIDVMGRARVLFCGPHISLIEGQWQADIVFDITKEAATHDYLIEFGTTGRLSRIFYRPAKAGQQIVSLRHTARNNAPVEVRIELLRAAFHGELKLSGCWITKIA
jgi:hypothetical protein